MEINYPENFENYIVDEINNILDYETIGNKISEMTYLERKFLNGIIRQVKPKKILEIGVAAGGGSSIILNAIKDIDNSLLYSIDYSKKFYRDKHKNSGFIVEEKFPHLLAKWKLYTGGVAAKFIDEIGGNIDLCLLDAMHSNPGEILDFLMILPYLDKNAVIVIHDIFTSNTCLTLFNTMRGKKIIFKDKDEIFNNYGIGAVILDDNIMDYIFDYFFLLKLNWNYMPSDADIETIIELFKKHYSKDLINFFIKVSNINKKNFYMHAHMNKEINKINKISWWIPFKKMRGKFKEKKMLEIEKNIKEIKYFSIYLNNYILSIFKQMKVLC